MGILTNQKGELKIDLVRMIDEQLGQELSDGKSLAPADVSTLAKKAYHYLSREIDQYSKLVDSLESLDQSSWGMPTGHEGLNSCFLSVCRMAIDESRLKDEIISAFKAHQP